MNFEKTFSYIESLYTDKSQINKREFIEKTGWKDFTPVVDDDMARFLRLLLLMKKPEKILEIGTSIGYSAASMALVAGKYGGHITTVEHDPRAVRQATQNFARAGVQSLIDILEGDALKILPTLADGSCDLVFQDVDKRLYEKLLPDCIRVLKPGGIFLADDALFPVMDLDPKWQDLIEPVDRFNRLVSDSPELESTLLPIGDGVFFAVKK